MLSNTNTRFLAELCDKYPENKYIIVEWTELKSLWDSAPEDFDFDEAWNELKINNCVVYKYKDDEEVCFTLTDKARVIVQEYKVLVEQAIAAQQAAMKASAKKQDDDDLSTQNSEAFLKDTYMQTRDDGSTVVIMPQSTVEKKKKFELKELKHNAFASGFIGGLISGGVLGLIFGLIGGIIAKLIG